MRGLEMVVSERAMMLPRGTLELPLPACGRAIAYGIFESFPLLGLWPICFSNRDPRNRIENKTESKLVRRLCLEERRRAQQATASSRFSICDTPAACGERSDCEAIRVR